MSMGPELIWMIAREIGAELVGARVKRVDAGDSWFALGLSRGRTLFFSWDAAHFGPCEASSRDLRELASCASSRPPIADAIKAHIVGSELASASAPGRDRVLVLDFRREVGAGAVARRSLALEASGRYSNAVLIDGDGVVIEAAKHIWPEMNRARSTLPGLSYSPPPPIDGVPLEEFAPASPDASAGLRRVIGIGRPLIDAIVRTGCDVAACLRLFTEGGRAVFQKVGACVTACPFELNGAEPVDAASALEAARFAVITPITARSADKIRARTSALLAGALDRAARRLGEARRAASNDPAALEYMREGRLILENAHAIAPRCERAALTEWTDDGPRERVVELDPTLDAAANAERRFAKYRKLRTACERAARELPRLEARLAEIDEQIALLECQRGVAELVAMEAEVTALHLPKRAEPRGQKRDPLPPHGRLDLDDLGTITWGLSSRGNHYVTFRTSRPDDIWFHAKDIPGSHVLLRFSREPDEDEFDRAVALAASCASEISRAKGERITVDFTERRRVRAIPGAGLAQVTYKDFSSITADGSLWRNTRSSP